jgi:hypothetical protein
LMPSLRATDLRDLGDEAGGRGATSAVRIDTWEAFRSADGEGVWGRSMPVSAVAAASMLKPRRSVGKSGSQRALLTQVPLLTCLRAATRISTGSTGVATSRCSPNGPGSCPIPTGPLHQTHRPTTRRILQQAQVAMGTPSDAQDSRHPARRGDPVGLAGRWRHSPLGPQSSGIRFGNSSGCC